MMSGMARVSANDPAGAAGHAGISAHPTIPDANQVDFCDQVDMMPFDKLAAFFDHYLGS
jgi:hypothetical protein